jgi:2-polyprenyl-3-methyl-5-hydroxy-6-metoxy-1,4-benzoquinol methylase
VSETHRVAPWWVGYLLLSPLRRWIQDPARILGPLVGPGQTVLEVGPAMGFFTLPLARLVGPAGRVIAVDCQERMLGRLRARATRAGLRDRIDARCCPPESLAVADLREQVDFVLAFNVLHEAAEPARMIGEMAASLRAGGRLMLSEPQRHVAPELFAQEGGFCREAGLQELARPDVRLQRTVVFQR